MSEQAEYICGCRSCGNHCMVVERDRSVAVAGEVVYSDGYLGGWRGVQTEVVTCPHCGIVISWRKNCLSADLLRKAGDLNRFYLPIAVWGPPPLYWSGFEQYDAEFHPPVAKGKKPGGGALPRLTRPPEASLVWSLRKRAWLARGLLWLENDRDRTEFMFGAQRPGKRTSDDEHKRARLLRALLEAGLHGGDASDANALDVAEWHRQLGEWDAAMKVLDRTFDDLVLADRAQQLEDLVAARNAKVAAFRPAPQVAPAPAVVPKAVTQPVPPPIDLPDFLEAPAPAAAPKAAAGKAAGPAPQAPQAAPAPAPKPAPLEIDFGPPPSAKPEAAPAAVTAAPAPAKAPKPTSPPPPPATPAPAPPPPAPLAAAAPASVDAAPASADEPGGREPADARTPRALLGVLLEVLGSMPAEVLTRDHIPRPYGALLRTLRKTHQWDEDSFAVAVISGFARAHGWPEDAQGESLDLLREIVTVDEALLDYLAAGFKRASWDEWAFDVPSTPAPKG